MLPISGNDNYFTMILLYLTFKLHLNGLLCENNHGKL